MNKQSDPSLLARILRNTFGIPNGLLGRVGGHLMARMNQDAAERVIDLMEIEPQDQVLEIGFGPGIAIERIAQRARHGAVIGIDYSKEMVAQASARNRKAIQAGLVELTYGSVTNLSYEDGRFDKVLTINSMQMWPDPEAGLVEIKRVMKSAGKIAVAFTQHARSRPRGEELSDLIESVGFGQVQMETKGEIECAIAVNP
ncbi:class I SAM-dependent methyltransferase [Chloroflexi bacterium TSY]|nr:class I SAM-dependent methyltransferase [Chloroflexi bacterium TSY]